jgi:hypothetical protein
MSLDLTLRVRAGGELALAIGLHFGYHELMSVSIRGTQNKRKKVGRPKTTGRGTQIGMRWQAPILQAIDNWADQQDDKPDRPNAIRRLVELGLSAAEAAKPRRPAKAGSK